MDKSLLDLTVKIRSEKKGMKTAEFKDVVGTFVVKLCGLNIRNNF